MELPDLLELLTPLPAQPIGVASGAWTLESAVQTLFEIRAWVQGECSRQAQAKTDLSELRSELDDIARDSTIVAGRVQEVLAMLDAGPSLEPGALGQLLASAREIRRKEDGLERLEANIGWLRSVQALLVSLTVEGLVAIEEATGPEPPQPTLGDAPRPCADERVPPAARRPSVEEWRTPIRKAMAKLNARLAGASQSRARWGLDYGTAQSKLVLRHEGRSADEDGPNNILAPSVVALRGKDLILFGEKAAAAIGESWTKTTSLKRLLIGKRMDQPKADHRLTTEGLTILYLAWMLHRAAQRLQSFDVIASPFGMSYPVAPSSTQPKLRAPLRDPFNTVDLLYHEWLPLALRSAQLIAIALEDVVWPEDQGTLVDLLAVVNHDCRYAELEGGVQPETMSEPVAAMRGYPPPQLRPGFTMVVDAGAGTTDVSVFWSDGSSCSLVAESSTLAGGDTLDAAVAAAVAVRLGESEEAIRNGHGLVLREWKHKLLAEQRVDIDPEELGRKGLNFTVRADDPLIVEGLRGLSLEGGQLVAKVCGLAEESIRLQNGSEMRPGFAKVWMLGGSAVVKAVVQGVAGGLEDAGFAGVPRLMPLPPEYATWDPRQYAVRAVAMGAAASAGIRSQPLWRTGPLGSPVGVADKEIQ